MDTWAEMCCIQWMCNESETDDVAEMESSACHITDYVNFINTGISAHIQTTLSWQFIKCSRFQSYWHPWGKRHLKNKNVMKELLHFRNSSFFFFFNFGINCIYSMSSFYVTGASPEFLKNVDVLLTLHNDVMSCTSKKHFSWFIRQPLLETF